MVRCCRDVHFYERNSMKILLAYCVENFQDTSNHDDNTNVFREPCVVNQDPGENILQEPPQIDHNCCYECGDFIRVEFFVDHHMSGDEHLDTIPATESDEVIKSSVENLVPIPSEFEGIFGRCLDGKVNWCPTCDNNCVNVESDFVESLINRDTSIVYSSKIDPIFEEFAGELAHIAPIHGNVEAEKFDPNDDTSINSTPDRVLESPSSFPISVVDSDSFFEESDTSLSHLDNSLPEFENSISHEYESFHFDNPSLPRPPPEPPDVENLEPEINNFYVLNNDEPFDPEKGENVVFLNVEEDDSFTCYIRYFLHLSIQPRRFLLYLAPSGVKIRFLTPASSLRAGGISFASPRTN
ncbi:hypothetical protein Tco_0921833 [Tanacetum coccineum]